MLPLPSHSAQREGTSFGTELCSSPGQQDQPCLELLHAVQISPVSPSGTWDG